MKKNIKFIVGSLLSLFLIPTGCDFLDRSPDDMLTMDMVFSDRVRTEDWLAGIYSSIPSPLWGYFKDQGFNIMADDITIPQDWTPYGWANVYAYTTGNWSATSNWNPAYWTGLPKRIRAALQFQQNVKVIPDVGLTEDYVEQMKYEARFFVAYYYSLMIEMYGPVPFNPTEIVSVDASEEKLMTPQEPYDKIVNWIDEELLEISKHLPAVYPSNADWGRVTSIMCLCIRAKTLLFAASPLFNGNPDFANWKNSKGENLFSAEYDESKWAKAADAFKVLIDAAEAAGYGLYYEYNSDGSIDPFMSCYNVNLKRFSDGNKEILFGRPENPDYGNWQAHHLPKGIGGNSGMSVTQELVDAFFMENGEVPILGYNSDGSPIINEASGYSESGFSNETELRKTNWPGGGPTSLIDATTGNRPITTQNTFKMYTHREPRFYVSVIFNNAWLGVAGRNVNFLQGGPDTDMTFDSPHVGYNVRKGVSLDVYPAHGQYVYQPGILYRLADAYLGYAEALNESASSPSSEVYKYVNLIRERAGIPDLKAGLTKAEMREAIMRERRVEFNCEGIRFNDLRRWKIADKYLNGDLYGMNHDGNERSDDSNNPNAFYWRKYYKSRTFSKRMYIWPVPQAQMDINPNLVQAPGY